MREQQEVQLAESPLSRRKLLLSLALVAGGGIVAACQAPAPTTSSPTPSTPLVSPSSSSAAATGASSNWDQVVAAAKQEGQVSVIAQAGSTVQDALVTGFQQLYPGITVNFEGVPSGAMETKVLTQRAAGQYTYDVVVHGAHDLLALLDADALDPLQNDLVGPNGQDPSQWAGGAFDFGDTNGTYIIMFFSGLSTPFIYDPGQASRSDFTSWKDLLDPKWKGKLAMYDPRIPGNAQALTQFWDETPALGRNYIQQLLAQDLTLTRDDSQLTNWIAHGTYAIGVGTNVYDAVQLKNEGASLEFLPSAQLKEGIYETSSWGNLAGMDQPPHPNAAKLYMDWVLSKQAQDALSNASGVASRRNDASTAGLLQLTLPQPGVQYLELSKEQYARLTPDLVQYLNSAIPN